MNDRTAFAHRGGDTADLLEMRRAARSGDHARVAELRSEGRGACCEFHAQGIEARATAAPARHVLTDDEVVAIALDFYAKEGM